MRCDYCNKPVFGADCVSVMGVGIAHKNCYQAHMAHRRIYKSIDLTDETDEELIDLLNLIKSEINARNDIDEDELF